MVSASAASISEGNFSASGKTIGEVQTCHLSVQKKDFEDAWHMQLAHALNWIVKLQQHRSHRLFFFTPCMKAENLHTPSTIATIIPQRVSSAPSQFQLENTTLPPRKQEKTTPKVLPSLFSMGWKSTPWRDNFAGKVCILFVGKHHAGQFLQQSTLLFHIDLKSVTLVGLESPQVDSN